MLRSSTEDPRFNQDIEEVESVPVEERPSEQSSAPSADDVSGFAEPPVVSTD
ncbi:MAG TPA: hypothetical protein VGO91_00850 [Pyrinomonadaceae bacterium]|jgi:hypothetical protein|nr:hypothetical protein [Pyrinomonadaceae bacterium]